MCEGLTGFVQERESDEREKKREQNDEITDVNEVFLCSRCAEFRVTLCDEAAAFMNELPVWSMGLHTAAFKQII